MIAALSVAGSDPTGGAGIEQDLRVFTVEGLHGMAVATALTIQDTARVHASEPVDAASFERRLGVLLGEIHPRVVKVGMLATAVHVEILVAALDALSTSPAVVVDPVLVSSSGASLLDDDGIRILATELIPRATVITPNRAEAARLLGRREDLDFESAAGELARLGPAVVITGGDANEPSAVDVVYHDGGVRRLESRRHPVDVHGTGCAFSAFIAAALARGATVETAIDGAKRRIDDLISRARRLGVDRPPFRAVLPIGINDLEKEV